MIKIKKKRTYEEIYGAERAKAIRKKMSQDRKGHPAYNTKPNSSSFKKGIPNPNKGKTFKELYGETKAKEIAEKASKSQKGKHNSRKTEFKKGELSLMKGRKHSIQTREKLSKTRKLLILEGKIKPPVTKGKSNIEYFGSEKAKVMFERQSLERLNRVYPKKDSLPEQKVQKQLNQLGYQIETHKRIIGQPDIYIPSLNLCIFVDGCYYHACHECKLTENKNSPLSNKAKQNWYRDFRIKHELELEGYKVIRLWEHEINKRDFNINNNINHIRKRELILV